MAQLRPRTRRSSENAVVTRAVKASRPLDEEPAAKRRALGDIGNVVGPPGNTRLQASKAKAQQHQQQQATAGQPTTRRSQSTSAQQQQQQTRSEVAQQQQQQQQQPASRSRPPPKQQRRSSAAHREPSAAAAVQPSARVTRSRAKLSLQGGVLSGSAAGKAQSSLPDIDAIDRDNPLAACTYVNDLYQYYRRVEPLFQVPANYMERQVDINLKMRNILVDWLVDVHYKFKLMPETLFLTTNIIDRYLAIAPVGRSKLQLVGATAMLIASKYEEVWSPEVKDFVYVSDKAFDRLDVLAMEKAMLKSLDYSLTLATSYQYLARLLKAAGVQYNKELCLFVAYCAELCLVEYDMLRWTYSEQAAGIMYVALRAFKYADPYPPVLESHACKSRHVAVTVAKDVVQLLLEASDSQLQAVVKKYSSEKFCSVSEVTPPVSILAEA